MDQRQRTKRFGICVILCACLLRLMLAGVPGEILSWLRDEKRVPFLIYLETGRTVRFSSSSTGFSDHFRESPAPAEKRTLRPVFSETDSGAVSVYYGCNARPDLGALLEESLRWELTGKEPTVLILHTHGTESYADGDYEATSAYRTLDETRNMLSIGDAVASLLEDAGIGVIHDRTIHDYPAYNGAYARSRSSARKILEQYPDIRLVLDLHRDALEKRGKQVRTEAVADGVPSAQLMLVVGTDGTVLPHENWQENLALALKLHVQLDRQAPGIMRPLNLRAQRFNQDLSAGAVLVEVGTAGNSHAEAMVAAQQLAMAVVALAKGSENTAAAD